MEERIKLLQNRLSSYGVDIEFELLKDRMYSTFQLVSSVDIAKRMIILYSCFHVSDELEDVEYIKEWLVEENLWDSVLEDERELFNGKIVNEDELISYSWFIEKAYVLAWTLGLIHTRPSLTYQISEEEYFDFLDKIPELEYENISYFLGDQKLISEGVIWDEFLLYDIIFDNYYKKQKESISIDFDVVKERREVLSWVCGVL